MSDSLKNKCILITGGAGFIGSNLAEKLTKTNCGKIKILDNLSTGSLKNIETLIKEKKVEFMEGDITDSDTCNKAMVNTDIVLHQAALGSVPRSIEDPVKTHEVNATGFLNILESARENKISRVIYASSSSVYGDNNTLPKIENITGNPLSPYAVSKKSNELYAQVYAELYNMEIIGLRYFNVFGPKQSPHGPYAAVIPIFINNILHKKKCFIYGDGNNRRDFTYIDNVVEANILAASTKNVNAFNQVFNIAYGDTKSVNSLFEQIKIGIGSSDLPEYLPGRKGEIKDSFASVEKAKDLLNYHPLVDLNKGIELTIDWYKSNSFK